MTTANPTAVENSPPAPRPPSLLRGWCYLVLVSLQRQLRSRQMVWIALALLVLSATMVGLITARHQWVPWWMGYRVMGGRLFGAAASPGGVAPLAGLTVAATAGATEAWIAFVRFSHAIVFDILMGFLLPLWSLSFATQALGNDREERSLVWLLSRPLPRAAIYLAKFVAVLPCSLALNLGGFGVLCLAAGGPGATAFRLYWPAVVLGTLAYAALFHLMGAAFRRPAVVAILYTFFVEAFVGSMPGNMKRISISFFDRCLMISAAERYHVQPPARPEIYMPVSGPTAYLVLAVATAGLLALGAVIFSRMEYPDVT